MDEDAQLSEMRERFEAMMVAMEARVRRLCADWDHRMDQLHAENRVRLQDIDRIGQRNAAELAAIKVNMEAARVKMDALYGNGSGRPGAVERLADKVDGISSRVVYGSGAVAAVVVLVGWYLSVHGK